MEDIPEVYRRPHDPKRLVVCLDEQPVQLIQETRWPLPVEPGQPVRYDDEYERAGTAVNFISPNPWADDVRCVCVRPKPRSTWPRKSRPCWMSMTRMPSRWSNLNTHTPASLYKAFPPEEARRLLDRLEIHYTPKHGSWLDIAKIELSVFTKQCLNRRIPDLETLRRETIAWALGRAA